MLSIDGDECAVRLGGMAPKMEQLRKMTDEELVALHDSVAEQTVTSLDYALDELHRREQLRAIKASSVLAQNAYRLSWANTVLAAVAAIVGVLALWLR